MSSPRWRFHPAARGHPPRFGVPPYEAKPKTVEIAAVASGTPPLWQALRDALDERDLSVRGFARELNRKDPRQTPASWKRTLNRYLNPEDPMVPSEETAHLMARILKLPKDTFVRQQRRELLAEENRRLREENKALRAKVDRLTRQRRDALADGSA